jgi:hypothetical protein
LRPTPYLILALAMATSMSLPAMAAPPVGPYEGVWVYRFGERGATPPGPRPEFVPAVAATLKARQAARPADYVRSAANMLCLPRGGPGLFTIRSPFTIMEGFGRIVFTFETEGSNQPRTIYMREKVQPENIYPSYNGHSIGHWEGNVLVVDTVGFLDRGNFPGNVPTTGTSHLIERFSWSRDGKVMTNTLTVEDPATLTRPFTSQIIFDKMADTEERFEVWCEPDLDAFATLDLQKLKAADPDVARMLDPATRASDPALKFVPQPVASK